MVQSGRIKETIKKSAKGYLHRKNEPVYSKLTSVYYWEAKIVHVKQQA
jgi:hypothetical protein